MKGKIVFLALFAVAMAFGEATVVVYLRSLTGGPPLFPMKPLPGNLLVLEIVREAATIAMLAAVALLSFRGGGRRFGAFLFLFAAWDALYYLWLRLAIGWPAGPGDWDILFLIPLPWVGPVWSVQLLCAGMLAFSVLFLRLPEDAPFLPGIRGWAAGVAGVLAVVGTYVREWWKIDRGNGVPSEFSVAPFLAGTALLLIGGWIAYRRSSAVRDKMEI